VDDLIDIQGRLHSVMTLLGTPDLFRPSFDGVASVAGNETEEWLKIDFMKRELQSSSNAFEDIM
jgi:hypothetical protein